MNLGGVLCQAEHCKQFFPNGPADLLNAARPRTLISGDLLIGVDGVRISK